MVIGIFIGAALYIACALAMMWSALRHRRSGWVSGAVLALLLLTLPLWVMALGGLLESLL